MKKLLYLMVLISLSTISQNKYLTKTGHIQFEASVPSFEEVAAENNSATTIINVETAEIAALVFVKGFRFKNALMEEHFNENYAESDHFPKAKFKGTISNFNFEKLNSTPKLFQIKGTLEFHGKTKAIEIEAVEMTLTNTTILITGEFVVNASDFDIEIPKIVRNKVSETIKVTFQFELIKT